MKFEYCIYQVKTELTREKGFQMLSTIIEKFGKVSLKDYEPIYTGQVESKNQDTALEDLFHKFNMQIPQDYAGRSMSVSDIIELQQIGNHGIQKFYYCNPFSWEIVNFEMGE